jgi:hypothetical protein
VKLKSSNRLINVQKHSITNKIEDRFSRAFQQNTPQIKPSSNEILLKSCRRMNRAQRLGSKPTGRNVK